jgi:ABC-type Fe3+/spermidine/putrescine transport system ATPase subunit
MLSVLENAVLGAWPHARSGFLATTFALPSVAREDKALLARATELLHGVGLGHVLHRRANLLDHAEQRFLEIARGLAMRPKFILLDEAGRRPDAAGDRAPGQRRADRARRRHRRAAGGTPHRLRVPHLRPRHDASTSAA